MSKVLRIPEDLLDAILRFPFGGRQLRIVLAVMRKTYRYGKTSDWISYGQLSKMLGIKSRGSVWSTVAALVEMKVLSKRQESGRQVLGIQPDFEKWLSSQRGHKKRQVVEIQWDFKRDEVSSKRGRVRKTRTEVSSKRSTRSTVRELQKRSTTKTSCPDSFRLATLLADLILANNPKHSRLSNSRRDETISGWTIDIDRLHRLDGQDFADIETVIRWTQADGFEKTVVLSAAKLRKRFDALLVKAKAGPKAHGREKDDRGLAILERQYRELKAKDEMQ